MEVLSAAWPVSKWLAGNVVFFRVGLHDIAKEMLVFAGLFAITFPFLVTQAELQHDSSSGKV